MSLRPTVTEERWLDAAERIGLPADPALATRTGGWRRLRPLSRLSLGGLGLVAGAMMLVIGQLLAQGEGVILAGIVAVIVAEVLIARRRSVASGLEEAIELVGALGVALECAAIADVSGPGRWLALAGLAIALVGWRLLNSWFVAAAIVLLVSAPTASAQVEGSAYLGLGALALAAGRHTFRRPTHDRLLDALVVVLPLAGYLWLMSDHRWGQAVDYRAATGIAWVTPLGLIAYALLAGAVGLRRRTHAPLYAAFLCAACTAYELRALSGLALESRLLLWGSLLLVGSIVTARWLRVDRAGITARRLEGQRGVMPLVGANGIAMLAAGSAAPVAPAQPPPAVEGGGGSFSGGGSSGEY